MYVQNGKTWWQGLGTACFLPHPDTWRAAPASHVACGARACLSDSTLEWGGILPGTGLNPYVPQTIEPVYGAHGSGRTHPAYRHVLFGWQSVSGKKKFVTNCQHLKTGKIRVKIRISSFSRKGAVWQDRPTFQHGNSHRQKLRGHGWSSRPSCLSSDHHSFSLAAPLVTSCLPC